MKSVFLAELAILVQFKSVGIILLVFLCVVVSLFAFAACECDSDAHYRHLLKIFEAKKLLFEVANRSDSAKNEHITSFLAYMRIPFDSGPVFVPPSKLRDEKTAHAPR